VNPPAVPSCKSGLELKGNGGPSGGAFSHLWVLSVALRMCYTSYMVLAAAYAIFKGILCVALFIAASAFFVMADTIMGILFLAALFIAIRVLP